MSFPFRCSIYVRYILLELNNTSSQVSYNKAFIITLKALASVSLSVTTVNRWQWRAVHPIWGWVAHPHSTVDWHTRWHIHTNTHDDIYVHTNTQRHIPKRTQKEVLKHKQHSTFYKPSLGCHKRPRPALTGSDFFNFGWAVSQKLSHSIVISQCLLFNFPCLT